MEDNRIRRAASQSQLYSRFKGRKSGQSPRVTSGKAVTELFVPVLYNLDNCRSVDLFLLPLPNREALTISRDITLGDGAIVNQAAMLEQLDRLSNVYGWFERNRRRHQPVLADEEGGEPEMRAVGTAGAVDLEWIGTR